jgi:flagellar basal body-associated protein FliL
MPRDNTHSGRSASLVIVLLLAVSVGAMAISAPATAAPSANTTSHNQSQSSSAIVEINESETTQNQVVLDRVVLPEAGYIVVQNDSIVTLPSGIVGHTQYVRAGSFEDVIVKSLDENVGKNATLTVSIHTDTNGNGDFDFVNSSGRKDGPVMGRNGKPITDTIQLSKLHNKSSNQTTKTNTSSKSGTNATATPTSRTPNTSASTESPETVTQTATATPTPTKTPTKTPTVTPRPSTPPTSVSGYSHPAKETPNGSVSGAPPGDGGDSGSGESSGTNGFAGLPQTVLLLVGAMVVFALGAMLTFAYFAYNGDSAPDSPEDDDAPPVEESSHGDQESSDDSGRPRAVVTFDTPDGDEPDADGQKANEAAHSGRVSLRALLASVFASDDADTSSVSKGDEARSEETENAEGESSTPDSAVTELEPEPNNADEESSESESPLVRAKAAVADGLAEVDGRGRMLIDRRAIDLRAYGVPESWETIRISVSDTDTDSVNRHLLTEIIDLGELEVEVERAATDGGQPTSGEPSRVQISHESVARLEAAAARGRPEAKRTVTLFRRVLRGCSSGTVVRRFADDSQEGSNVTVR